MNLLRGDLGGATDELLRTMSYIKFSEIRTNRKDGFKACEKLERRGIPHNESLAVSNYMHELALTENDIMSDITILNAGAGNGDLKPGLKSLGSKARVINVDINSNPQIDIATQIENMSMVPDESIDMVVANWAIPNNYYPDTEPDIVAKEIQELYRVTKKGGTICFVPIKINNYTSSGRDSSGGTAKANNDNVILLLQRLHQENPNTKFKIVRRYENFYAKGSLDYEEHNSDYTDLLIISK